MSETGVSGRRRRSLSKNKLVVRTPACRAAGPVTRREGAVLVGIWPQPSTQGSCGAVSRVQGAEARGAKTQATGGEGSELLSGSPRPPAPGADMYLAGARGCNRRRIATRAVRALAGQSTAPKGRARARYEKMETAKKGRGFSLWGREPALARPLQKLTAHLYDAFSNSTRLTLSSSGGE